MLKVLAYLLSIIHFIIFGFLIVIFHPIQVIGYNFFGYNAHRQAVVLLSYLLIKNFYTLGGKPVFQGFEQIPINKPLIIVANHQSMYDIAPVVWGFRKNHPKFISKKELGKNIPSISYNLKKGGSVLIDRKNGSQSIKEILKLGKKMEAQNWSVCIFPEGTRSKDGQLKTFQLAGFKTLLKASPNALIVPFAIDGNYKLHQWGNFPLVPFVHLKYTALAPIERTNSSDEVLLELVKSQLNKQLSNQKMKGI